MVDGGGWRREDGWWVSDDGGWSGGDGVVDGRTWDGAVKRAVRMAKMLAAIENKNEAGVAKRLRKAGALNTTGRLLYFYGLGIALASNNNNHDDTDHDTHDPKSNAHNDNDHSTMAAAQRVRGELFGCRMSNAERRPDWSLRLK